LTAQSVRQERFEASQGYEYQRLMEFLFVPGRVQAVNLKADAEFILYRKKIEVTTNKIYGQEQAPVHFNQN
jgi:hypothetical protein